MLRIAIQFKELVSSNVTSMIEAASHPAKMLLRLQREIEEAIISLQRERTLAAQRKTRLEAQATQTEMREADWSDKAKTAMNHGREDLARQALLAREDCTATLAKLRNDIAQATSDLDEVDSAIAELEAKREDVREQARNQMAADAATSSSGTCAGTSGGAAGKADAHRSRIAEMEKRTAFATEDYAEKRTHAAVDDEIDAMRREAKIEAELAAMKGEGGAKKAPAKKRTSKKIA
jgi:phage shock protein A